MLGVPGGKDLEKVPYEKLRGEKKFHPYYFINRATSCRELHYVPCVGEGLATQGETTVIKQMSDAKWENVISVPVRSISTFSPFPLSHPLFLARGEKSGNIVSLSLKILSLTGEHLSPFQSFQPQILY